MVHTRSRALHFCPGVALRRQRWPVLAPTGRIWISWLVWVQRTCLNFGAAVEGEDALRRWLNENATAYRSITGREIAEALGGLVPEVDKRALTGDFADHLAAVFRRSLAHGFDGWIDDDLAFVRPWGFKLGEIGVPVTVWQGELDLMVPLAHGRWLLEKIPGAARHIVPGQGHISLAVNFRPQMLDDLRARTHHK